ncbi:MAG: FAD-dependent oxidoreductase [Acidobacteriales bacterium]|nr:FAD-dependent oxidoreductase [Terriglobales bacterium]
MKTMEECRADVIVVGAGVAGLAATGEMCRGGLNVLILEGRDRVGGRIFTLHPRGAGTPVELGAEFIHGKPPDLWKVLRRAGIKPQLLSGEPWCRDEQGLHPRDNMFSGVEKIFEAMQKVTGDCSFADFLRTLGDKFPEKAMQRATSFVEGFNAARRDRISVQSLIQSNQADEKIHGDLQFRINEGYDRVVNEILRGIPQPSSRVLLKTVVKRIEWKPGRVTVLADSEAGKGKFLAPMALVTLPLGVLQAPPGAAGAVEFSPPLHEKRRALDRLEMGPATRVTLRFAKRFWAERSGIQSRQRLSDMGFLFASDADFPTWWTTLPRRAAVVTGWAAGPHADALAGRGQSEIIDRAVRALAGILAMPPASLKKLLVSAHTHDWQNDRFSRGAYSYALVGGAEAPRQLAAPIADTLFFAGEATDFSGHNGTVHGALASGERAAQQVLALKVRRLAS